MANENEMMNIPEEESTATTSPPTRGQCSYSITKNSNNQKSNKHPHQGPSPPQRSLSINPNAARVSQPNANRTIAEVVRSPLPPPRRNGTRSIRPAALWINSNVAGSGATSKLVQLAPQPSGFWARTNVTGSGASLYRRHHPYTTKMHHEPPRTVDFISRMEGVGSVPSNPRQRDQELLSIADFLAHIHNNPWRTIDFLSQMEAATPAPVQVRRARPTTAMLVQWGSSLRIGNGGTSV